jgi:signal transduction histidine kinase
MNTLRVKIAILLVVAIVSVVGLFSVVLFYLMGPPPRGERALETVAQQVELVVTLAGQDSGTAELATEPATGRFYRSTSERLKAMLASRGIDLAVRITRSGRGAPLIVSIPIEGKGWLMMPASNLPPAGPPWRVLFRWFAIITFAAALVAVFAANRMVKPLVFLESAVDAVGPDGMLPVLPEKGPAEVRATAKALNSLSARLKRAMESRMRMVAAAGHDLRTPITRMRLRAEFVPDEEERARWLADLDELERIADSAILLVREESGKAPPELVRLDQLVDKIGEELRDQSLDVVNEAAEPVAVRASPITLNRALRNLIINAATHGVRAHVKVDGDAGANARIVIEDEGPGIPSDLLGQVFEPFFRADPARRQDIPGAGLGLTIAKEIIQREGGTISISNRAGGGLLQVVELPKAAEMPA